jgi:hypothetical protein
VSGIPASPPGSWERLGESPTMEFFVEPAQPGVLLIWPREGVIEDRESALATQAFIFERTRASRVAVVVFLDRIAGLDRGARDVHMGAYGEAVHGVAYVGATPLARALLAFAIGLQRNVAPVRLFSRYDDAQGWCRELLGGPPK